MTKRPGLFGEVVTVTLYLLRFRSFRALFRSAIPFTELAKRMKPP